MSADHLSRLLLDSRIDSDHTDPWLNRFIEGHIKDSLAELPEILPSKSLLVYIGQILTRALSSLSLLGNSLARSEEVHIYMDNMIRKMEERDDLSDLGPLENLNQLHSCLRHIASQLKVAEQEIKGRWELSSAQYMYHDIGQGYSPKAPDNPGNPRHPMAFTPNFVAVNSTAAGTPASGKTPVNQQRVTEQLEEESDEEGPRQPIKDGIARNLYHSLETRGKGTYTCPYGQDCAKGGVGNGGVLVVFERNSAIK